MFFEGSEKKVEVFFVEEVKDLRERKALWEDVVTKANATILSKISSERCDAYLLSESSLFVFERRFVMITCGTTTLIHAIERAITSIGTEHIELLMYERKNELDPEAQLTSFGEDTKMLSKYVNGESLAFGRKNGNRVLLYHYTMPDYEPISEDMTLEILMHQVHPKAGTIFQDTNEEDLQKIGIRRIFNDFLVDDFIFDPMGYSLNGVKGREYYTIHVTPQQHCSYASFETNHFFEGDLKTTIQRVLDIFKPESVAFVLFVPNEQPLPEIAGYVNMDERVVHSCGYRIHFRDLKRKD